MTTLVEQGRRVALAVRVGTHLSLVAMTWSSRPPHRRAGLAACLATSLAADAARHVVPTQRFPASVDAVLSGLDTAWWRHLAPDRPDAAIAAHFLSAAPPNLRAGLAAGRSAEPRLAPGTLLPGALAVVIAFAADRRAGRSWGPHLLIPAALHLAGSAAIVTHQAALHRAARERWMRRISAQVREEGRLAAASAAVQASPGHNFKKVLMVLGANGSEPALLAAYEQGAHPAAVVEELEGTTLLRAALGLAIVPAERADTFISGDQRRELAAQLDRIDEEVGGRTGTELVVDALAGRSLLLRYQGRSIELAEPAPRPGGLTNVDPMPALLLAIGASSHAIAWLNPTIRAPGEVVAPAVIANLVAAGIVHRRLARGTLDRPLGSSRTVVATNVLIGAVACSLLVSHPPTVRPSGRALHPATHLALPGVISLATYRERLPSRWRVPLAVVLASCWAGAIARDPAGSAEDLLLGALLLGEAHVAGRGASTAVDHEVANLQVRLRTEFTDRVGAARRSAQAAELHRFEEQVALAERELERLGGVVSEQLASDVRTECEEVRRWLRAQRAEREPGS